MAYVQKIDVSTDDQTLTLLVDENSARKLMKDQNYLRNCVENLKNIGVLKCISAANNGNEKVTKSPGSKKATQQSPSTAAVTVSEDTVVTKGSLQSRACGLTARNTMTVNEDVTQQNSQNVRSNESTDRTPTLITVNEDTVVAQGGSQSSGANDLIDTSSEWNRSATVLLISTRLKMESEFQKPIQKNKLWNKISNVMKEHGYIFGSVECHTKWRNLMSTYRKNVEKSKLLGSSSIRWRHFNVFHEVYGNKSNVNPSDTYIRPSVTSCSSTHNESLLPLSSERLFSYDLPVETPTHKKKIKNDKPPAWFLKYLQKKEEENKRKAELEEQRWQDMKEIENRKLEVMAELTNALKKYLEK